MFRYQMNVRPLTDEDGGGWLVEVPALPGCMSDGETAVEALENVQDAIHAWIETAHKRGMKVPDEISR